MPLAGLLYLINPDVYVDPVASKKLKKNIAQPGLPSWWANEYLITSMLWGDFSYL